MVELAVALRPKALAVGSLSSSAANVIVCDPFDKNDRVTDGAAE
jgi:hypothetical protein